MSSKFKILLSGVCSAIVLAACQSSNYGCPEGFVETTNVGMGEPVICCPFGTIGQDGYCVDAPSEFEPQPTNEVIEPEDVVSDGFNTNKEINSTSIDLTASKTLEDEQEIDNTEAPQQPVTSIADNFVYLSAPNEKGSAYCPKGANSLAWNGIQFKCCGYGLNSVSVPSRNDSICCPVGSVSARWIGEEGFDYECCPAGLIEVKNEGNGDKYICCQEHEEGKNGKCVTKAELARRGKVLLTALNDKGQAYCPKGANSLAWNAEEFECCGKGMKATIVPSRGDSLCCPVGSKEARWVGQKWNDFDCCPKGTFETKNQGVGDKYLCCPKGHKALNGECLSVK